MTIDEMVAALDERSPGISFPSDGRPRSGERWDLYRRWDGQWGVTMTEGNDDPARRTVHAPTIAGALQAALDRPRLPVVPPEPKLYRLSVEKTPDGRRWTVMADGRIEVAWTKTKRDATERHDDLTRRQVEARDAWFDKWYALIQSGTEGVDFYWKR